MLKITDFPTRACSADDITRLERGIGSRLPQDYAAFLLRCNGGYCGRGDDDTQSVFAFRIPSTGNEDVAAIAVMYSYGLNDTSDTVFRDLLLMRDRMCRADPPIPDEMIPIGQTRGGGWIITLGVAGRFRDGVYLNMNRHDMDWEDILLARSFTSFEAMVTQRVV